MNIQQKTLSVNALTKKGLMLAASCALAFVAFNAQALNLKDRVSPYEVEGVGVVPPLYPDLDLILKDQDGNNYNLGDAIDLAKSEGRPMVLQFCTNWCGFCAISTAHFTGASIYDFEDYFTVFYGPNPQPLPPGLDPFPSIIDKLSFSDFTWIELLVTGFDLNAPDPTGVPSNQTGALLWHDYLTNGLLPTLHDDGQVNGPIRQTANEFYVRSYPSFLTLDRDGRIIGMPVGATSYTLVDELFKAPEDRGPEWTDPLYYFLYDYMNTVATRDPLTIDPILSMRVNRFIVDINTVSTDEFGNVSGVIGVDDAAFMIGKLDEALEVLCDKKLYKGNKAPISCTAELGDLIQNVGDMAVYYASGPLDLKNGDQRDEVKKALLAHDDFVRREGTLYNREIPGRPGVVLAFRDDTTAIIQLIMKDTTKLLEHIVAEDD